MSLRDDLKAYADGELDPLRANEVESALARDPALRQELEQLRALSLGVKRFAAEIHPEGLEETLAALNRQSRRKPGVSPRWLWGSGLALAALCLAVLVLPRSQEDSASDVGVVSGRVAMKAGSQGYTKTDDEATDGMAKAEVHAAHAPTVAAKPSVTSPDTSLSQKRVAKSRSKPNPMPFLPHDATGMANRSVALKPSDGARTPASDQAQNQDNGQVEITASKGVAVLGGEPQKVALEFPSVEDGEQKVLALVGKYKVPTESAGGGLDLGRTIEVDLPEDQADKLIADVKALAVKPVQPEAKNENGFSAGARAKGVGGAMADAGPAASVGRGKSNVVNQPTPRPAGRKPLGTAQKLSSVKALAKKGEPAKSPEVSALAGGAPTGTASVTRRAAIMQKAPVRRVIILISQAQKQ